jgi:CheY-like chemotaxis protein
MNGKLSGLLGLVFSRRRRVGEDTRRLPSLVKAMHKLVPKSVIKEVVSSSHDRRQWGVLAAAWVGVSEREFVSAAARELRMPYQDRVPVPDMTVFGDQARSMMSALRKVGAIVTLQGSQIVGFIATDPAEVRGLEFFDGMQNLSMAPWTEIVKALDMADRVLAEASANQDRLQSTRKRELCEKVLNILIEEAVKHGTNNLEILSGEESGRYQFSTVEGRIAVGSIHPEALESLLFHLNSIEDQDEVYTHALVGKVLVRSLGSASNIRLSWNLKDRPVEIEASNNDRIVIEAPPSATANLVPLSAKNDQAGDTATDSAPILVVDDNPMFCRVVERLLGRENYQVSFAENGQAALDLLARSITFLPRVIICDLHMPELNGKEFVRLLKSDPRLSLIPVIMLTSDDGVDVEVSALETGADALISKSKDPRVLCAHVTRLVKLGSLREAA